MNSKITRVALALLVGSLALPSTQAQPTPPNSGDASRVFPLEAEILDATPGRLVRLPIPAEVLQRSAPDLADVRIHGAQGRELPYMIDSGARSVSVAETTRSVDAVILRTDRRIERGDSLAATFIEHFEVTMPTLSEDALDAARQTRAWTLNVSSRAPRFVAQVSVEAVDGDATTPQARGSIYRFPTPERAGFTLSLGPLPTSPGRGAHLVIEVRGESGYLEPTLTFETSTRHEVPEKLTIALQVTASRSENGVTTVYLERPSGVAPDRLLLSTTTANFQRDVSVFDAAQGESEAVIGQGLVYRVQEVAGAEVLAIPLARASGQTLRVTLQDEDSPALEDLHFSAEVTQPSLVFTAEEGAILRFGGGRVRAPHYDLMRIRSGLTGGLGSDDGRAEAHLGAVRPNPNFDAGPALGFALVAGRPVPLDPFSSRASVHIADAREGLSRLDLSPEVLAASREAMEDIRLVDAAGLQRPYLKGAEEPRNVELPGPSAQAHGERSSYELSLPASPIRVSALYLDSTAEFLGRSHRLIARLPNGRERTLSAGYLARSIDTQAPLEIHFEAIRVQSLRLEIEDGGDAPLTFSRVTLELHTAPLFLVAPDGDYTLYFGDPELAAPVYELNRARDLVLSLPAATAALGGLEANPAHVPPAWYAGDSGQTLLVWVMLVLGLIVLILLTVRVARSSDELPKNETASSAPPQGEAVKANDEPESTEDEPPDGQAEPDGRG